MMTFDLSPYQIQRPEKVDWWFSRPSDVLDGLQSKGLKDFVKHLDEVLVLNNLRYVHQQLDQNVYENWLDFYQTQMLKQGYDIIAKPGWFQEKSDQGYQIEGIFIYQHENLVGTGIFTRKGQLESHFNFKASVRLKLSGHSNSSLGACLDYLYLNIMSNQGVKKISGGRSRNAFGVVNSLGHLDYKLKFGYVPAPAPGLQLHDEVSLNDDGIVVFLGCNSDQWSMYAVHSTNYTQHFEVARFASPNLPFKELIY